jgi:arylformamidase
LDQQDVSGDELDRALNPRLTIPDAGAVLQGLAAVSADVLDRTPPAVHSYGPSPAEYVDVYPTQTTAAPVHLFIHGGFWRSFSARDYAFVAPPLRRAGVLTLVVNYGLCPDVSLDEIVRQCRAAVVWARAAVGGFGGDPARITVSGHSAGGHLAAMLALTDWAGEHGLPADVIKGAYAVSGLFDLAPIARSWLRPTLQLTPDMIRRNSPILLEPAAAAPITAAVGEAETPEFHRQSRAFVAALSARGHATALTIAPGRNHLDILHDLRDGVGLHHEILRLARGEPP